MFTAEAKQNTGTTSTSTGREISTEDESISSDVAKTGSHCVVYNNDNNNDHEEGPSALCSEESGTPIKERSTEKTLTGNENKHANKKSISKAKGRKKKQKKASKGTKSSQTTTKAKDKEDRKEDEEMCSEGIPLAYIAFLKLRTIDRIAVEIGINLLLTFARAVRRPRPIFPSTARAS